MSKLRGGRIGMREKEGLVEVFITDALRQAGIDPFKDVQWVYDPVFGYRNNPAHMEMLRRGESRPSLRSRRFPISSNARATR